MKNIFYTLMLVAGISLSGCSDWLDIFPKNEQVTDDYWKSKEDVEAVLTSGYYFMRETTPFLIDWGELRANSIYAYTSDEKAKMHNFQLLPSSDLCKWGIFYKVINMANSILRYAPGVVEVDETYTEAAMKSHQAEAYFMRAWAYFTLVRNFKEVPLVMDPYVDDSAPYTLPKSAEEVIIAQVKADVKAALDSNAAKEFFDNEKWNASKGRATKWALYALMAEVCLWSEDYDGCVTYTDLLINATGSKRPVFMSISEQWISIFYPGNSNESVFEMNWDAANFSQTAKSPSSFFKVAANAETEYQYSPTMVELLIEDYNNVLIGKEAVRSRYGAYVRVTSEDSDNVFSLFWKYVGTDVKEVNALRTYNDANYILYRMADVMLMKAEALIWKGGQANWVEAMNIMNQIRVRANLPALDLNMDEEDELSLLNLLLHERNMELASEGKRWYDLVRFGKNKNYAYKDQFIAIVADYNSSASDSWIRSVLKNTNAWYLPIHSEELDVNQLLEQNPYYAPSNK